jgi:hypothetical protein
MVLYKTPGYAGISDTLSPSESNLPNHNSKSIPGILTCYTTPRSHLRNLSREIGSNQLATYISRSFMSYNCNEVEHGALKQQAGYEVLYHRVILRPPSPKFSLFLLSMCVSNWHSW